MKVKISNLKKGGFKATMDDGVEYTSTASESLQDFKKRMIAVVEDDYMEVAEFVEAKAKKAAAKKVESTKKAAKEKKAAKPKVVVKKLTIDEVVAEAEKAKIQIGTFVNFDTNTGEKVTGEIRGVTVDKRVPMAMYRIKNEHGRVYHKRVGSKDLEVNETKTARMAERRAKDLARIKAEKAKAAKEKEAAKAKKEEAREKAKAKKARDKEAAAAARDKEREKAKAAKEKEKAARDKEREKAKAAKEKQRAKDAKEKEKAKAAKAKEREAAKKAKAAAKKK